MLPWHCSYHWLDSSHTMNILYNIMYFLLFRIIAFLFLLKYSRHTLTTQIILTPETGFKTFTQCQIKKFKLWTDTGLLIWIFSGKKINNPGCGHEMFILYL